MKLGFPRSQPGSVKPPTEIKPEAVGLPAPLKVPPPEPKPWWIVVVAVGVVGIVVGMVVVSFASGARTFNGAYSIFPLMIIFGVVSMLFGGRFGGGGQQMSRGKMDALRARFMLVLDDLRERVGRAADALDTNYRWYHPPVQTLAAAVGGPRMWERNPNGRDTWFGVARVGVGMTSLVEGGAVTFSEPQDMPTEVEMEPATGTALQEFVRFQSVAYGTPALLSLLVEPGYRIDGNRDRALGLVRSVIAQLVFSHGADHLQLVVVTDDVVEWDWVKWLAHNGDPRREDAAGPARMVYTSVEEFADSRFRDAARGAGVFVPRHAAVREPIAPLPHTVVVSDIGSEGWQALMTAEGVAGWTFFDLRGGVPACADPGDARLLRIDEEAVVQAVPRDVDTWAPHEDEGLMFFAVADQLTRGEVEQLAQRIARWRIAEPYEDTSAELDAFHQPRDILSYYGISDPAAIDFGALWGPRNDINSPENLRIPFGNRADNGELLILDIKDMNTGGDGPHGVLSGTTGSGKTTLIRTIIEALILGHPPQNLQMVLADCKGGAGVKPFENTPHVPHIITDLEDDQILMDRFITAMWGEIARRKGICNEVGADDADEYNLIRAERALRGEQLPPLPRLLVVLDEFKEAFRIKPDLPDVLDQIGRQGRSLWVHMLLASQDIDSRAERLLENVGYRLVLRQNTSASASAAGVPTAVNLPKEVGVGYLRLGLADDLTRFRSESLWRDYRRPGSVDEVVGEVTNAGTDYLEPQLFTTHWAPLPERVTVVDPVDPLGPTQHEGEAEDDALRKPQIGRVIIDQLREIDFEPYRLWQPPLDVPHTIDSIVNMYLGRRWEENYAATADLVFPVGLVDRPYKHDQQPLVVEVAGDGSNQLIVGVRGSGKTTALQALICAAAMTHSPEQVQFYCLALSSPALGTVAGLPHVGGIAYALDEDGVRRTVSEMLEILERRQRSFPACGITSMDDFRLRKFGGVRGQVPDDPFGDVFLVVDNYQVLTGEASTLRNKDLISAQIQKLVAEGAAFGVHVIVSVERDINLPPRMRGSWPRRIELKLQGPEDARLFRGRLTDAVPAGRPGRGMVAQNYVRLGAEEEGLHTLIARPALAGTGETVFDSASVVDAVRRAASGYRSAPRVRQLPAEISLAQLQALAVERDHVGLAWALDERDELVGLSGGSPFLMITGREHCGRTNVVAAIMTEIERVYAPGSSSALSIALADERPRAQVWLVDPSRELLQTLSSDYVERFTYRSDEVATLARDLNRILLDRLPEAGLSVEESLTQTWSGPEIFLIVNDAERLPAGYDAPLRELEQAANAASDVGLRVVYSRRFGGWSSAERMDPLIGVMKQANAPLLVMDSDADEGPVRGRWRGHPMPPGRGFLMSTGESGNYVHVGRIMLQNKGN